MELDVLSDLVILKVRSVSTMYNEAGAKGKRRDRGCWSLIIKYEGETVYSCGGKNFRSDGANLMVLPKGASYEWQCTRSGHCIAVEFDADRSCGEIFPFPVKNGEKILKLFKEMEYKRTLQTPMIGAECIRDTYDILLRIVQSQPRKYLPTEKQRKIAPALEYIAKYSHRKIRNDQLAALTGLSTVYFRKLFAEVTGQSPIDYIQSVRIRKAREMLQSDFGSVTEIAFALGYQNIYDFSRTFKKYVGISPLQYKKREIQQEF